MKVRDLLETNGMIGDLTIDVRGRAGYTSATYTTYLYSYAYGVDAGKVPPYPAKARKYVDKPINLYDRGHEQYQTLISKIPDKVLDLNVYDWTSRPAYRASYGYSNALEHLYIHAWTDETLDEVLRKREQERQAKLNKGDQIRFEGLELLGSED